MPLEMRFDPEAGSFSLTLEVDKSVAAPTEVYVPRVHFDKGVSCQVTAGRATLDLPAQRLRWDHQGTDGRQELRVERS